MPACLMLSDFMAQARSWPCSSCWQLSFSLMLLSRGPRSWPVTGSLSFCCPGLQPVQGLAIHQRLKVEFGLACADIATGGHPSFILLHDAAGARASVSRTPCPISTFSLSVCSVWRLSPRSLPSTLWPTSETTGGDGAWALRAPVWLETCAAVNGWTRVPACSHPQKPSSAGLQEQAGPNNSADSAARLVRQCWAPGIHIQASPDCAHV